MASSTLDGWGERWGTRWGGRWGSTLQSQQDIVDTDILQKPVNVVMMGNQPIKDRYREYDIRPMRLKETPVMWKPKK